MRANVLEGETPFRRAYIRSVIDQVKVDDSEIRIRGRKTVLERLVMGGGAAPAAVPSFVREWRARRDSNAFLNLIGQDTQVPILGKAARPRAT